MMMLVTKAEDEKSNIEVIYITTDSKKVIEGLLVLCDVEGRKEKEDWWRKDAFI